MSRQSTLLSVLAGVLVVALWWFFVYSPQLETLAGVQDEVAAAEAETASLRGRVARLEAVRAAAPETEAAIAGLEGVVPTEPALASAQRQLVAAAQDAGTELVSLSTTRPAVVDLPTGLHSISLAISVTGSYFQVVDFLRRIEDPTITTRGIHFSSVALVPTEYPELTVSMTGTMYTVLEPSPDPDAVAPVEPETDADADAADGDAASEEDAG